MEPTTTNDVIHTSDLIDQESWVTFGKNLTIWAIGECVEKIVSTEVNQIAKGVLEQVGQQTLSYLGFSSTPLSNQIISIASSQVSHAFSQVVTEQRLGQQTEKLIHLGLESTLPNNPSVESNTHLP